MQFSLAKAVNSLESNPAHDRDVLTADVGDQISLACIHENNLTSITLWVISPPVNCATAVIFTISATIPDCNGFSFEVVTRASPFSSTAVATASASMTGAVVQCRDNTGAMFNQIGRDITLCIIGEHACILYVGVCISDVHMQQ